MDWSSEANPFGYSIIPPVQNQGICGACWAFASTASVEAAMKISLHEAVAHESRSGYRNSTHLNGSNAHPLNGAAVPLLSAQQLIDCDRAFNTGCNGGSPWYALQYVSINGVVSSRSYPFAEKVT